ncbi:MAG: hypothetical protein F4166_04075 [Gammaproteobacteria bacterium]|nr:hypothetical protein [Gammaproteobacteria bacterium]
MIDFANRKFKHFLIVFWLITVSTVLLLNTIADITPSLDTKEYASGTKTKSKFSIPFFVPEPEREVLRIAQMSEEQKKALTTIRLVYYFAGISDAVQKSTVKDKFEGWEGDTLVQLTDGSTFKQKEFHFEYTYRYRPEATILLDVFSYEIHIENTDVPIEVELIDQPKYGRGLFYRYDRFKSLLAELPEEIAIQTLAIP